MLPRRKKCSSKIQCYVVLHLMLLLSGACSVDNNIIFHKFRFYCYICIYNIRIIYLACNINVSLALKVNPFNILCSSNMFFLFLLQCRYSISFTLSVKTDRQRNNNTHLPPLCTSTIDKISLGSV